MSRPRFVTASRSGRAGDDTARRSTFVVRLRLGLIAAAVVLLLTATAGDHLTGTALGQAIPPDVPVPVASLKGARAPVVPNLGRFVRNKRAGIELGKALFWDMQAGSDGVTACATCHFNAGADSRSVNQLNPSLGGFDTGRPNYRLRRNDFPFHKVERPNQPSPVVSDSNDVVSSQGVVSTRFQRIVSGIAKDGADVQRDPVFNVKGTSVRQVEPFNTPTVINAVFNFRNFWNGRAQNEFNGVNPFGSRAPNAGVIERVPGTGQLREARVDLINSSLASQALGPPLSSVEMSASGRRFPDLGRKMLSLRPLAKQRVHPRDSVLGRLAIGRGTGLRATYRGLIRRAFEPRWWRSNKIIRINRATGQRAFIARPDRPLGPNEFTLMEYNFSLFWGLGVQLYESTLIADDTPVDRFLSGRSSALTAIEREGLQVFEGQGGCINCHGGAELTNASVATVPDEPIETMIMGNGEVASYDNGFYNIGVRPTREHPGVGGVDPFGNPLSETRLRGTLGRTAVDGAFKTPQLRNVALSAPYFHNGGALTLNQVVSFYNRGGDFPETNIADLDADIQPLSLSRRQRQALVAFLKALTDDRVRFRSAPFDHPQICIPNGHPGSRRSVTDNGRGRATDRFVDVSAVGRRGGRPLPRFLDPVRSGPPKCATDTGPPRLRRAGATRVRRARRPAV
ncbi:MAG: cytochrome-c peroxidase, partial [Actinomycetota bacterium]